MHVSTPDATTQRIIKAAFPAYKGRKIQIIEKTHIDVQSFSYWSGGSRSYYTFVRLADMQVIDLPSQSQFERQIPGSNAAPIPEGFVCVEHCLFCGKDLGIRIYANPANMTALLPATTAGPDLSDAEKVVLACVCGLKSAARRDYAERHHKLTAATFDAAKASLMGRGLLSRQGAATPEGRNLRDALKLRVY